MSALTRALVVGLVAVLATGCGSGKNGGSPSSSRPRSTYNTGPIGSPTSGKAPTVTVTPRTGLRDGQKVQVTGRGFTPGRTLQVVECGYRGQQTAPGDCNLGGMDTVIVDGAGGVATTFTVVRGPFGTSRVVCSATQDCVVAVTEASLTPGEEANAHIRFTE